MSNMQLCGIFIICGLFSSMVKAYTYTDEETLRTAIFTGYNNNVRPETPQQVSITISLMSLNYVDIAAQEMCVNIVIISVWTDARLAWDPAAHNNIDTLVVKYDTIWIPTLVIENTIDNAGLVGDDEKSPHRISSDGSVMWLTPVYARVSCTVKVAYFPFDQQSCSVNVYGWSQTVEEVNISASSFMWMVNEYTLNGEWDLESTDVLVDEASDGISIFKVLAFTLTFKRRWVFMFLGLIIPAILNSLLMIAVFLVPFDEDKLSYSLTVLLSYYVLLTLVSDTLPPVSTDISILQMYLTFVMCIGTISTLVTVWAVSVYKSDDNDDVPSWLVYAYYNIFWVLTCRRGSCKKLEKQACTRCDRKNNSKVQALDDKVRQSKNTTLSRKSNSKFSDKEDDDDPHNDSKSVIVMENESPPQYNGHTFQENEGNNVGIKMIDSKVSNQTNGTIFNIRETKETDEEMNQQLTWQMVATMMDALSFRIIGLVIFLCTFIMTIIFIANY